MESGLYQQGVQQLRDSEIVLRSSFPLRTVCEVTREIFDLVWENKEKIGEELCRKFYVKLNEQIVMQKKMDARLKFYKADWLSDEGLASVPDYKERAEKRMER